MRPADVAAKNREGGGHLASLSAAIQSTHEAMADIPDPAMKSKLAAALNTLTTVQEGCHAPYQGPNRSAA
jgi:hypothetical protein